MRIMIKPLGIAATVVLVWLSLRHFGVYNPEWKADEGVMSSGTIAVLGIMYALLAATVLGTVWSHWRECNDAAEEKDETVQRKFWRLAAKKLPATVSTMLGLFSLMLVGAFFLISYKTVATGTYSVGSIALGLALIREVISDLADPLTGVWNVENPPPRP